MFSHLFTKNGSALARKTHLTISLLLKCLYHTMKMSGDVYVCWGISILTLSTICFIRFCSNNVILFFHFIVIRQI
jgi:hypothetical protein